MSLLDVRDLVTHFKTDRGVVQAVNGVSFTLGANFSFIATPQKFVLRRALNPTGTIAAIDFGSGPSASRPPPVFAAISGNAP